MKYFFKTYRKNNDANGESLRVRRTKESTIFELVALVLLIALWTLAISMYRHAPESIPTHFDLEGNANNYGSRLTLLVIAGVGTLIGVLMMASAYAPKQMTNVPMTINNMRQVNILSRMLRIMGIVMILLMMSLICMIGYPEARLPRICMMVLVGVIVVVPVGFTIAARSKKS